MGCVQKDDMDKNKYCFVMKLLPLYWQIKLFSDWKLTLFQVPGIPKLKATWFWLGSLLGFPGPQLLKRHREASLHCQTPLSSS